MAQIGWIDFSPTHRDRVGAVLDLLCPESMVDKLRLGTLRDAMSNQLFPGISTIQSRAKYFFIIPYILYDYQLMILAGTARGKGPSKYLEQREYENMWDLGGFLQGSRKYRRHWYNQKERRKDCPPAFCDLLEWSQPLQIPG